MWPFTDVKDIESMNNIIKEGTNLFGMANGHQWVINGF